MVNEKRLIDANALANRAFTPLGTLYGLVIRLTDLRNAPTVDAVEVVRCEDCKHYRTSGCAMDTYAFDVVEEGFCSYGERREGV